MTNTHFKAKAYNTQLIDGKAYAATLMTQIKQKVLFLKDHYNIIPRLEVILVGHNPASVIYVNLKKKRAAEIGIDVNVHTLPHSVSERFLVDLLHNINQNTDVHGILVQLPLPQHINVQNIIDMIDPLKDVDGFSQKNVNAIYHNYLGLSPCTPQGVILLIKQALGNDIAGKKVVIVGRSMIVGKPLALMLLNENCTVEIAHSKSRNVSEECKTADILIVAAGRAKMINRNYVKPGACVIDVGINKDNGTICGDVDTDSLCGIVGYVTPVPGGVGPMTIACLFLNVIKAIEFQCNMKY